MEEGSQESLPAFCRAKTLVLGCGNILFGDDGFGCALVEYLETHCRLPEDVCVLDVGTGVRNLLFTLLLSPQRPRRLLLVDSVDVGGSAGELFEMALEQIAKVKEHDFSTHQIPTSNLLRELQTLSGMEVRVLACQTGPRDEEIRLGLSPPLQEALAHAVDWLAKEYFPVTQR